MNASIARWVITLLALLAVGPFLAAWLMEVRAGDGSRAMTLLLSQSPVSAILRFLAVLFAAAVVGVLAIYAKSRDAGMIAAGLVVCWSAWHMGSVEEVIRVAGSLSPLRILSLEALLVGALGAGLVYCLQSLSWKDVSTAHRAELKPLAAHVPPETNPLKVGCVTIAVAAVVAGLVGWIAATHAEKGQAVAAAALAGLAAAGAAQLAATVFHARATPLAVMIGLVIVAVIAPLATQAMAGGKGLEAIYSGNFLSLGRVTSLDWVGGGLIGIPIGLGWAEGMVERT